LNIISISWKNLNWSRIFNKNIYKWTRKIIISK
jgi:hypothetical protein